MLRVRHLMRLVPCVLFRRGGPVSVVAAAPASMLPRRKQTVGGCALIPGPWTLDPETMNLNQAVGRAPQLPQLSSPTRGAGTCAHNLHTSS